MVKHGEHGSPKIQIKLNQKDITKYGNPENQDLSVSSNFSEDLLSDNDMMEKKNVSGDSDKNHSKEIKISSEELPANNQFTCIKIPKDGDCLFHSIIVSWTKKRDDHFTLRQKLCDFMVAHLDQLRPFRSDEQESLEHRINRMRKKGVWGSNFEIFAFSQMANIHVLVFQNDLDLNDKNPIVVHPISCHNANCQALSPQEQTVKIFYSRSQMHYSSVLNSQEYSEFLDSTIISNDNTFSANDDIKEEKKLDQLIENLSSFEFSFSNSQKTNNLVEFIGEDLYRYPKFDKTSDKYNDFIQFQLYEKTPKDELIIKLENEVNNLKISSKN